jgi:hypothetical protein
MDNVNLVNHTQLATSIEAARVLASAPVKTGVLNSTLQAAVANRKLIFTGAKRLLGAYGNVNSASTRYVMIFDQVADSLPTLGTRPDVPSVTTGAYGEFNFDWSAIDGRPFVNGCLVAVSSTQFAFTDPTDSTLSIDAQYCAV